MIKRIKLQQKTSHGFATCNICYKTRVKIPGNLNHGIVIKPGPRPNGG